MSGDRSLRDVCSSVEGLVSPQISSLREYKWVGPSKLQTLEFITRAVVVRQYEAAVAILALVDAGHGSFGVTLLRPAFEELVWLDYLRKHQKHALELVQLISHKELLDSYNAQKEYLGQKVMRSIGFSSRVSKRIEKGVKDPSEQLKRIGKQLGWRNGSTQPTMAFVARQVGREAQYKVLYQGTSRAVHFSPHELQRRVWGRHGSVEIGSSSFGPYWTDFALSWSFRLLLETMIYQNVFPLMDSAHKSDVSFQNLIKELRPVQILTATELEAWEEPMIELRGKQ